MTGAPQDPTAPEAPRPPETPTDVTGGGASTTVGSTDVTPSGSAAGAPVRGARDDREAQLAREAAVAAIVALRQAANASAGEGEPTELNAEGAPPAPGDTVTRRTTPYGAPARQIRRTKRGTWRARL